MSEIDIFAEVVSIRLVENNKSRALGIVLQWSTATFDRRAVAVVAAVGTVGF